MLYSSEDQSSEIHAVNLFLHLFLIRNFCMFDEKFSCWISHFCY